MQIVHILHKFAILLSLLTAEMEPKIKKYINVMSKKGFFEKKVFRKAYIAIFKNSFEIV
jgi:hypothetical protein